MANQDYYKILGVSKEADQEQIKAAYRNLAFQFHPDRNNENSDTAEKMKQLNEAYAVLSDAKKRRDYDSLQQQYGSTQAYTHFRKNYSDQDIFSGSDINSIFDELAKSFGFRNFDDISKEFYGKKGNMFEFKDANVSFKGIFFFGTFNLGKSPFKINFPGKIGRLARTLQNMSGARIPQQGKDFHDTIQIDPDLARKGGPYAYYHTWASKKLVVKIPPNVRQGQQIRLAGMGEKGKGKVGDLYLKIETKSSLMSKIKKILPF